MPWSPRWPWPRAVHSHLLDILDGAGVPVVGFTVLFADSADAGDDALAQAMHRRGGVVLPMAPLQLVDGAIVDGLPTTRLREAAARVGHVDAEIDLDGRVRRIYLNAGAGAARYPALALALLEQYQPQRVPAVLPGARAAGRVPSADSATRWLRDNEVMLPRMAMADPIGITRLLDTPGLLQQLRGRMVVVGVSASGLGGELASPLAGPRTNMPAVQLHVQAYEALRAGTLISPATSAACLVFGLLLACLPVLWPVAGRQRLHPWWLTVTLLTPVIACVGLLYGLHSVLHRLRPRWRWWRAPWSGWVCIFARTAAV